MLHVYTTTSFHLKASTRLCMHPPIIYCLHADKIQIRFMAK